MADVEIHGTVESGWEAVRDAFAGNFAQELEVGASAYVTHEGKPVVDIWAGDAKPDGTPWAEDTIVNVYSTTKTMCATSLMMLVDRGLVDPDAPVATYWPEFAANGKEAITVAQVMAHTSGLSGWEPAIDQGTLYDWEKACAILAAQAPWWEPGTMSGYHAVTHGYLQGEIVRRVDGRSLGTFFREEVAEPLGADFHIGFGPEHDHRCGELVPPPVVVGDAMAGLGDIAAIAVKTFTSSPIDVGATNTREWRAAEIPAAGGFGNARSVGRVHSALACGGSVDSVTLMTPETVARIGEEQYAGHDLVLLGETPLRYGLGFGLPSDRFPRPGSQSFWWGGYGGSLAIIDPEHQLTVSYVMNRMEGSLEGDIRGDGIALSAYAALMG